MVDFSRLFGNRNKSDSEETEVIESDIPNNNTIADDLGDSDIDDSTIISGEGGKGAEIETQTEGVTETKNGTGEEKLSSNSTGATDGDPVVTETKADPLAVDPLLNTSANLNGETGTGIIEGAETEAEGVTEEASLETVADEIDPVVIETKAEPEGTEQLTQVVKPPPVTSSAFHNSEGANSFPGTETNSTTNYLTP
jgi:hypothetical protein